MFCSRGWPVHPREGGGRRKGAHTRLFPSVSGGRVGGGLLCGGRRRRKWWQWCMGREHSGQTLGPTRGRRSRPREKRQRQEQSPMLQDSGVRVREVHGGGREETGRAQAPKTCRVRGGSGMKTGMETTAETSPNPDRETRVVAGWPRLVGIDGIQWESRG